MLGFRNVILSEVRSTKSIYDTWQLVALVELGSQEQDPVIFKSYARRERAFLFAF